MFVSSAYHTPGRYGKKPRFYLGHNDQPITEILKNCSNPYGPMLTYYILAYLFFLGPILAYAYGACACSPFVPSKTGQITTMTKIACLTKLDCVYEIGCGDGRIIRRVAKMGVREAIGYEISVPLVLVGKATCFFTANAAKILFRNLWSQDYSRANVIFCYLLPDAMQRFKCEIYPTLKKGTRIISNTYPLEGLEEIIYENRVYLYLKQE